MTRTGLAGVALLLGLAACVPAPGSGPAAPSAANWSAALPPDSVWGAGDPARAAVFRSAHAFSQPATYAGHPADAARAIADVEFLSIELTGPRWTGMPLAATQLAGARAEWRSALGIAPGAPPQAVIDSLYNVRRALAGGQPELAPVALSPAIFSPGGTATLQRLAALPPLPRTAAAASNAEREMSRAMFDNNRGGGRGRGRR